MDSNDEAKIRQMLTDILSSHVQEINGRYNVIYTNLLHIKEQTTKTNGRVTALEDKLESLEKADIQHIINCPNTNRIGILENQELRLKMIFKFVTIAAAAFVTIAGLGISIFQIITK